MILPGNEAELQITCGSLTRWQRMTPEQKAKDAARKKAYQERNKEKIAKRKKEVYEARKDYYVAYERNRQYQKAYGIDIAEYDKMLASQDGKCKLCKTQDPKTHGNKYFAVDHCHKSGKVRGLLCSPCNIALGFYEQRIGKIEAYLRENQ